MFIPLLSFFVMSPWRPVTEEMSSDQATLNCSVAIYERCKLKVKLLFSGTDNQGISCQKTGGSCDSSLKLPKYHYKYQDRFNSLKCEVKNGEGVQEFAFRPRPSGEDQMGFF